MNSEKDRVIRVKKDLLTRVKLEAVKEGISIKEWVEKSLEKVLSKKSKQG